MEYILQLEFRPRRLTFASMSNWFASWFDTEYYHQLYNNRDESEAERFITNMLDFLKLPQGSKVLDIACGKGRHAKAISEKGYDVVGTDLSPNSIEEANKMRNDHLEFFVQDMREPFRDNEFDAAFNFFTSFGYFDSEQDNINAANAFVKNLKSGGVLLIDFVNKAYALKNINAKPYEIQMRGETEFKIERKFENNRFVKEITVCENEHCNRYEESLQALTQQDFESYFLPLGMELKQVFGNYDLEAFDVEDSPRLILLLQKK